MNLAEFTQITLSVASENGIESYAPTIIAREQVHVIQGIPEGYDHRQAIQEVILQHGLAEEDFFFGVRSAPQEITTGHHRHGAVQFARILGLAQGFTIVPLATCDWWDPGGHRREPETEH